MEEVDVKPVDNLKCPRCDSTETKFCYFNNHQKSQPRYFCKTCQRFWTQGGTVRDIRSKEEERRMKAKAPATGSSSSGGGIDRDDSSSALVVMGPAGGNIGRVGTILNLTRPVANRPPLKFTRVDTNSLSLARRFDGVLNPCMASPQEQGQNHTVQPSHQDSQASYGQGGFAPQPSNQSSFSWGGPSSLHTTAGADGYTGPSNANIFWHNSNQIGDSTADLSESSSEDWPSD